MPSPLAAMISAEVGVSGSVPSGRFCATGNEAMRSKNGAASAGDAATSATIEARQAAERWGMGRETPRGWDAP